MRIFKGLFKSRDKPQNSYDSPSYSYFFGRTHAGKRVNDRTAMQIIAVYACVRVLSEAIAQLPLHVYEYTDKGKERVPKDCAYIEVFQNNYKQRLLQQAITMKSGYFNEVSGFFCVILFVGITSV